jgi:hypothetical protein
MEKDPYGTYGKENFIAINQPKNESPLVFKKPETTHLSQRTFSYER